MSFTKKTTYTTKPLAPLFNLLAIIFVVLLTGCVEPTDTNKENTEQIKQAIETSLPDKTIVSGFVYYGLQCASCHGLYGQGSSAGPSLINCSSCLQGLAALKQVIEDTMPIDNTAQCDSECASLVAEYILSQFKTNTPTTVGNSNDGSVVVGAPPISIIPNPNPAPTPAPTVVDTVPPPVNNTLSIGQTTYQEKCGGCHGAQGQGGRGGPTLILCAACGSGIEPLIKRIIDTMPLSNPNTCDRNCAQPIAEYILANFTVAATVANEKVFSNIGQMDLLQTLQKTTLNLAGRSPTNMETQLVQQQGHVGLERVLDNLMQEDVFYQRLTEVYNDVLLQNAYLTNDTAINLLSVEDYPQREWYKSLNLCIADCLTEPTQAEHDRFHRLRNESNDAVASEVYQLIQYIVKNNRPFTEILTANYTMVNYYSARVYGVENQIAFRKLNINDPNYPTDSKILNDNNYDYDPSDFRPVQLGKIPHAGLLTSHMFLNRFPTTKTNRNRHRAKTIFSLFLDTEILAIGGMRPDASKVLSSPTPTLDNPMCSRCHSVMDPVASAFQDWDIQGRYRPASQFEPLYTDMLQAGFTGTVMPLAGNTDRALQWLAAQIVNDPRFARATVKTLFKGLTGQTPLIQPASDATENSPERLAFLTQRKLFVDAEKALIASNYNIRSAIKVLLTSPWWRADNLIAGANPVDYKNVGSVHLLTPEMLDRKIAHTMGITWMKYDENRLVSTGETSFNILYGGIDSDTITQRNTDPNGIMLAVQKRMAMEVSCKAVPFDFSRPSTDRVLFPYVDFTLSPSDPANSYMVKRNIAYLHNRLWQEPVDENSLEVSTSYQLLLDLHRAGLESLALDNSTHNRNLNAECISLKDPTTGIDFPADKVIIEDANFNVRAWMGLVNYLIADFKYLYE